MIILKIIGGLLALAVVLLLSRELVGVGFTVGECYGERKRKRDE